MVQNKSNNKETPYLKYETTQAHPQNNNNDTHINQVKKLKKQNESLSRLATVVTSLQNRLDPNNNNTTSSSTKRFEDNDDDLGVPALINDDSNDSSFDSNDSDFLFNTSFLKEDYDDFGSPIFQRKRL